MKLFFFPHHILTYENMLRYTNEINIRRLVCAKVGQECGSNHQGQLN